MEVESTDSLSAGAAGSFNFGAAVPGAMPDSRSSESGDANNERLNAHGSTADADPLIDSGDTEPDLTLDEVIDRLVVPHIMSDRWNFLIGEDRRRRIDMTPAQFMNALLKYFDPEFLVRSGPFERVGEHVQLIASLNG